MEEVCSWRLYQYSGIKKKQNNIASFCKRVLVPSFAGAVYAMSQMTVTAFAAGGDTSAVTKLLDNLKTLVIAVIGAVGVIILAKNVMDVCSPYISMGLPTSSRIFPP